MMKKVACTYEVRCVSLVRLEACGFLDYEYRMLRMWQRVVDAINATHQTSIWMVHQHLELGVVCKSGQGQEHGNQLGLDINIYIVESYLTFLEMCTCILELIK